MSRKLTLADIADQRAYERERADFRTHVIELKRRRRVHLGTVVTVVFENRDTMRFQVQEMARVEKISTDEGILEELNVYNPMIPEPGELCATLFLELTTEDQMREWLPKLVGVERSLVFRLGDGTGGADDEVRCTVEAAHASQLTREHVTAAVHFVQFRFTPQQVERFTDGVVLAIDHPAYQESIELDRVTVAELVADLSGCAESP
jgi:ribosomal protein L19